MAKIRFYREANKLKQKEVADYLGISQSQYSRYEAEPSRIKLGHLIELAYFYNVDLTSLVDDLLDGSICISCKRRLYKIKLVKGL